MRRKVFVAGFEGNVPLPDGVPWERVSVACLRRGLREHPPWGVILLGDGAAGLLDPEGVLRRHPRPDWEVIVCLRVLTKAAMPWVRRDGVRVCVGENLEEALDAAVRIPPRAPPPRGFWLPAPLPREGRILEAVRVLERGCYDSVKGWAGALGSDRHRLKRLFRGALLPAPAAFVEAYRDLRVAEARRRGLGAVRVAVLAGYANGSNLRRRYRRVGRPFPPRGRPVPSDRAPKDTPSAPGDPGRGPPVRATPVGHGKRAVR